MQTESSSQAAALRYAADEISKALHAIADIADQQPGEFYTVAEAAKQLRVTDETIYRRIKAGTLESIRVGGKLLIPVDALRQAVAS